MKSWLSRLLDLEQVRPEPGADMSLQWQWPWPSWLILLTVLSVGAYVVLVYRREGATPRRRFLLGTVRAVLLLLVVAILCQPVLVLKRTRAERAAVALLVDTSASMGRKDRYTAQANAPLAPLSTSGPSTSATNPAVLSDQSRIGFLQQILLRDDAGVLRMLARRNAVEVYGFAGRTSSVCSIAAENGVASAKQQLAGLRAEGPATDIGGAVQHVLAENRSARLAAVIVASDGRNTLPIDIGEVAGTARRRGVPIHTVRLGSSEPQRDAAIDRVQAEESVFVKDPLSIEAQVSASGLTGAVSLRVQLREEDLDAVLAEGTASLEPARHTAQVELRTTPGAPGRRRYRVSVAPLSDEAETSNNTDVVEVNVVDARIRVLYVEGYPRFEYRYLKNALLRENTITSSCLLLSADEGFAQEGTEPIRRFPESREELNHYDVVMLGDVDPRGDWITEAQLSMLQDFVGQVGGGFGMIAGERHSPYRFRGTVVEKLLPVAIDPDFTGRYEGGLTEQIQMRFTLEGRRSPIFRFEEDPEENDKTLAVLPGVYWFCRTRGARPGAEVLAEHPTLQTLQGPMPVVVVGRYGAGKVFFQAMDESWRWRRHGGEAFFDAYWLQAVRYLTRGKLLGQDRRFRLETDRRDYQLGEPVTIRLTVLEAGRQTSLGRVLNARIVDKDGVPVRSVAVSRVGEESSLYEGSFVPPREGSYSIRLDLATPASGGRPPGGAFRVILGGAESRVAGPDHEVLKRLAAESDGESVMPADLPGLAERIPDRGIRLPDDITEALWDTRLVLTIFVLIITVEWIARKASGMV